MHSKKTKHILKHVSSDIYMVAGGNYSSGYVTSSVSAIKPRTKVMTTMRPRLAHHGQIGRPGSMVIPVGSHVQAGGQTVQNIHIKPVSKPTIHIKQEGGKYL